MDDEWDADNAEAKFDLAMKSNKWEGEDEEEEVKDSWEDMEDEKKDVEKPAEVQKAKLKPKKTLADKIEERERKARQEMEEREKEKNENMTPEEKRADLLRRQKLQEEADLRLAMDTFGVSDSKDGSSPDTEEEFTKFQEALMQKINQFNKHPEFPKFAEDLMKAIALNLSAITLKRVKTMVEDLASEKQKMEKGDKGKKKGKGKAKLKQDGNTPMTEYDDYVYGNEYDDFM